jgi:Ca-activated chloride channel family protein
LIRENLGHANFFAFGIGSAPNRYIIEGIAHVGMGEPFIVLNQAGAETAAEKFRKYISNPVLTNILVDINTFDVYDVEPPAVPDVFAERPVILFGKYRGALAGTIDIEGLSGSRIHTDRLDVAGFPADPANEALRYLWARHKIRLLDDFAGAGSRDWNSEEDYQDSIKQEVTALGLKYNLLTRYTSFVAVDSVIRADSGSAVTVKQPLPLPEGVTDDAIGHSGMTGGWGYQGGTYQGGKSTGFLANGPSSLESSGIASVYPNPFSGRTNLKIFIHPDDVDEQHRIRLYNSLGQLIDEIRVDSGDDGWKIVELDFVLRYPGLASGVYSAVMFTGDRRSEPVRLLYLKR